MLFLESAEVIGRDARPLSARAFRISKNSVAQPRSRFIFSNVSLENQPTAGGNYGDESRPD
jgi:hypothetical protein